MGDGRSTLHNPGVSRSALLDVLLAIGIALCALAALPFVPALLWATALAVLSHPLMRRFSRLGPTGSALAATLVSALLLALPVVLLGLAAGVQVVKLEDRLQGQSLASLTGDAERWLSPLAARVGIEHLDLREALRKNAGTLLGAARPLAAGFLGGVGRTLGMLVIALLAQFYLLRDGGRLKAAALPFSPLGRAETEALLARTGGTVPAVFVGTVLVSAIQGAIMGGTFAALGVTNALLLGVLCAVLCLVPVLGAPVMYVPAALVMLVVGNPTGAAVVLGVGAIVVSQIDNVVRPALIGDRVSLHPLAIFFAILGGTVLVGPIGLVAGPMLLTLVLGLLEAYRLRLEREDDAPSDAVVAPEAANPL